MNLVALLAFIKAIAPILKEAFPLLLQILDLFPKQPVKAAAAASASAANSPTVADIRKCCQAAGVADEDCEQALEKCGS